MNYGYEIFVVANCSCEYFMPLKHGTAQLFSTQGLLKKPTGVFSCYFKIFEASCKAGKALKIYL